MLCECGGILMVIRVEEPPQDLPKHEKLIYNRLCDVQCVKCEKIVFSKPYDFGKPLNPVREIK